MLFRNLFILLLGLWVGASSSSIQVYEFDDINKEQQFNQLVAELRCPKCQNNNLADSNSELSIDLKNIIYEKVDAGESDQQIVDFLKARYGDFISYRPPVNRSTWLIWFGPFVVLLIGAAAIFQFLSARRKNAVTNTEERQRDQEVESVDSNSHSELSEKSKRLLESWSAELQQETEEKPSQRPKNSQQGQSKENSNDGSEVK